VQFDAVEARSGRFKSDWCYTFAPSRLVKKFHRPGHRSLGTQHRVGVAVSHVLLGGRASSCPARPRWHTPYVWTAGVVGFDRVIRGPGRFPGAGPLTPPIYIYRLGKSPFARGETSASTSFFLIRFIRIIPSRPGPATRVAAITAVGRCRSSTAISPSQQAFGASARPPSTPATSATPRSSRSVSRPAANQAPIDPWQVDQRVPAYSLKPQVNHHSRVGTPQASAPCALCRPACGSRCSIIDRSLP
jgi:hypothetical protein